MGIPMFKMRRSQDHFIFNMGFPILVRRHFYIKTPPGCHLYACMHVQEDASTQFTIYWKPIYIDLYLNFRLHHLLVHKRSGVRICANRTKQFVTTAEDKKAEFAHVHEAHRTNNYSDWALELPPVPKNPYKESNMTRLNQRPMLVIPYVVQLPEQVNRIYRSHDVHKYHKLINNPCPKFPYPHNKAPIEHRPYTTSHMTMARITPKLVRPSGH